MSWGWYTIASSSVGVPLMVLFDTLGNLPQAIFLLWLIGFALKIVRKLSVNLLGLDALMIGRFKRGKNSPVSENQVVAIFRYHRFSKLFQWWWIHCSLLIPYLEVFQLCSRISVGFLCLLVILSDHEEKCVEQSSPTIITAYPPPVRLISGGNGKVELCSVEHIALGASVLAAVGSTIKAPCRVGCILGNLGPTVLWESQKLLGASEKSVKKQT